MQNEWNPFHGGFTRKTAYGKQEIMNISLI